MKDWKEIIVSNKEVLVGKPVVKGTRLSVEFILKLYAAGWPEQQILDNYPRLTREALQVVMYYDNIP